MNRAHGEFREERRTLHIPKLVLRDDAVRRHRPVPRPRLPIAVQLGGGAFRRGGAARCCSAFLLQVIILLRVPVIFRLALGTGARAGVMIGQGA